MAKKPILYLIPILVIALIAVGIIVFSANEEQPYVTAEYDNTFSTLDNKISWVTRRKDNIFLEIDGELVDRNFSYKLDSDPNYGPHFGSPLLIGDYLYYVGGVYNTYRQSLYIARTNYTEEEVKFEKLTDDRESISAFTLCGNKLYYIAGDGLYIKDLTTKKEEFFIECFSGEFFCTNGKNLIIGNTIYDIKTKESKVMYDEYVWALGVIDNYYYCYYVGRDGDDIIRIDLTDFSSEILFNAPLGWYFPKMCGDKILFNDAAIGNLAVGYHYYDISKDEIITIIAADDEQERYIHNPDHIESYDYTIFNDWYYFDYPDKLTRMNINTKEEELFSLVTIPDDGGYTNVRRWITYDEYLVESEKENRE